MSVYSETGYILQSDESIIEYLKFYEKEMIQKTSQKFIISQLDSEKLFVKQSSHDLIKQIITEHQDKCATISNDFDDSIK
ncbi:hypothetical protein BLNAU_3649 [Blattamonas nauphoetae]|uniref:General transcription and DNA repair factor IIH subunit TFB5 n=1 Tax=Blattamonas nauphoetae TaxID=2049346 RepID=A0ABQ9YCN2_9EUKA|nr:hypothetical protein BLNAU_3649 [Blattamonas nauphoetae]